MNYQNLTPEQQQQVERLGQWMQEVHSFMQRSIDNIVESPAFQEWSKRYDQRQQGFRQVQLRYWKRGR